MSTVRTAILHDTITEDLKGGSDIHIYGDFATHDGGFISDVCMPCFWAEHGYEGPSKNGWVVSPLEGMWCTEPKGWVEFQ